MKTKIAFWIALLGTLAGIGLRCIQMLYFFNYETGFVTDSGVFTVAYCAVVLSTALAAFVLCMLDRTALGAMHRGSNWAAGAASLLSALFLIVCAAVLVRDYFNFRAAGVTFFVEPLHVEADLPFAIVSAVYGFVCLVSGLLWFQGKSFPGEAGALGLVGVVWGLYFMLLTFMTYSASATVEENIFTVGGGTLMVLFFLAEGKLLSGIGRRKAARAVYAFGIPAAVLWLTYVVSNTVLIVAGRGYATEMPYIMQLVMLAHSVRILALLLSFRKRNFIPADMIRRRIAGEQPPQSPQNGA